MWSTLQPRKLFVNMVTYNTESSEDILIEMMPHALGLEVSLTDYDVERFDPTSVAAVNVNAPLDERTPRRSWFVPGDEDGRFHSL